MSFDFRIALGHVTAEGKVGEPVRISMPEVTVSGMAELDELIREMDRARTMICTVNLWKENWGGVADDRQA